ATEAFQDQARMKFTGHERDLGSHHGTGDDLDYMHARHCSPLTARFTSVDPAGSAVPQRPQTWNQYAYGRNNPLNFIDPDGREEEKTNKDKPAQESKFASLFRKALTSLPASNTMPSVIYMNGETKIAGPTSKQVVQALKASVAAGAVAVTLEQILEDAKPGRKTTGRTTQFEKEGGELEANQDFDSIVVPGSIDDQGDGTRIGMTQDGKTVIVRPDSTEGRPTLEIQDGKKYTKIRYGQKR
ncbi:MAG: RHS repeat-associated core domain-containing protein, partial [Deltaproteobacteria bacterium]|nr:RHS repeat-associated core domain-containing protein [Deltaproteobacteria bacterium]